MKFKATVLIDCETQDEADQVLAERLSFDEDYGFDYTLDWSSAETPVTEGRHIFREGLLLLLDRADAALAMARLHVINCTGCESCPDPEIVKARIDIVMSEIASALQIREHTPEGKRNDKQATS